MSKVKAFDPDVILALVPEGRRVYRDMTVWENLEMGAYSKRGRQYLERSRSHVIELFPILDERKDQRAGTLSGGEQQMLAIGRALMSQPEMLFIDGLSLGLAPLVTKQIYLVLDGLAEETTILMVQQNVEQALKHSHRAYVLESGHMTRSGLSKDLKKDEDIRRAYLVSERKPGVFSKIKSKIPDFEPDVALVAGGKITVFDRALLRHVGQSFF